MVRPGGRLLGWAGVVATLAVTSACSRLPDAVNPVAWYQAMRGNPAPPAADTPPVAGPFPRLSEVPERPIVTSPQERRATLERLEQDRAAGRALLPPGAAEAPALPGAAPAGQAPAGAR